MTGIAFTHTTTAIAASSFTRTLLTRLEYSIYLVCVWKYQKQSTSYLYLELAVNFKTFKGEKTTKYKPEYTSPLGEVHTVSLLSCLTGLDLVVSVHSKNTKFTCLVKSNPVKLETNRTVILPIDFVVLTIDVYVRPLRRVYFV